jgi:hypothetical protein
MKLRLDTLIDGQDPDEIGDEFLIRLLAEVWADPDLRPELGDQRQLALDCLREYGQSAYLDIHRRQALSKALLEGPDSLQRRSVEVLRRREDSALGVG